MFGTYLLLLVYEIRRQGLEQHKTRDTAIRQAYRPPQLVLLTEARTLEFPLANKAALRTFFASVLCGLHRADSRG